MIKSHEKFRLADISKKHEFFAEVNWNEKDEAVNHCKLVRFTFPDGTQATIPKEHLMAMLFAMGNEAEQMKMIPQKLTYNKWYETVVSVVAKADIAKGEKLTFPIKISLPASEEDIVGRVGGQRGIKSPFKI